jgi:hypothetical protein
MNRADGQRSQARVEHDTRQEASWCERALDPEAVVEMHLQTLLGPPHYRTQDLENRVNDSSRPKIKEGSLIC